MVTSDSKAITTKGAPMKYSLFAALALLFSSGLFARDDDDELPAVTNDDLLAVRTADVFSSFQPVFTASSPKRLVEAIQIDIENSSSEVCIGRVQARFFVPSDDETKSLAYLSAQPGESQNTYVVLPRLVLVDPAATEWPSDILLSTGRD